MYTSDLKISATIPINCKKGVSIDQVSKADQLNFAYYGVNTRDCTLSLHVSFTEETKRQIPAGAITVIKLGNGEIVGTRTKSNFAGVQREEDTYISSFEVFFNQETASRIAIYGVSQVRLAYDQLKLDWITDDLQSKALATSLMGKA